jgi:CTP:molybdopterin cytidylyltransferase MocA
MAEDVTAVLPCAGSGRRLGLPFGKELLPLGPGRTPLDATLELLRPHAGRLRLVVVLGSQREATARHIAHAAGQMPVAFISQRPGLGQSTGAVLSAEPWFGERNIVLLPDQILTSPPADPVGQALELLGEAPFCFLASRENDPVKLSRDGALRVSDTAPSRLLAYAEHPAAGEAAGFNAVWFGFGFRREHAIPALSVMHRAVCGESVTAADIAASPLAGCPVLDAGPYRDAGTWPAVLDLWSDTIRKGTRR